jgi:peptidoglycan biosynthesis protein MviN/MurJ (putative lipid II flippase)
MDRQGLLLASLRALQIGVGVLGQVLLLARWSPDAGTDLFLVLSGVPWLVSAAALIGGLDVALPAAYQRARAAGGEAGVHRFTGHVAGLALAAAFVAAPLSAALVAGAAARSGLGSRHAVWMGLGLGGQIVPAALGELWQGVLVARHRLVRARLALLAGSALTLLGYALLPGPPALALPLTALAAATLSALCAGGVCRAGFGLRDLQFWRSLHPQVGRLAGELVALGAAGGLVHVQAIVERAMLLPLGTGAAAAGAAAGRVWEAALAVVVAAGVMPVFPRWAAGHAREAHGEVRRLLRWSLGRTLAWTLAAGALLGLAALALLPWLRGGLRWQPGAQAARMVMVLLPRFVLLAIVQPLVMKQVACGTPWPAVLGAALGAGVLALGGLVLVPRWGLAGVAVAAAASVLPGLVVLGRREVRGAGQCAC